MFCTIAGEEVVFGFVEPSYTVNEGDGTVIVCAQIFSGTIGNRTFIVDFQTNDGAAVCKLR